MKKLLSFLTIIVLTSICFAQAPEKMSYQAMVKDSNGGLVISQTIGMQISILQTSTTGTAVYVETQTPTTNVNGLVTLEIGTGNVVSGDFTTIDWSSDTYYTKTETDPTGGANYTISGTSQLLSVPYALYAKTSGSSAGPAGQDGNTILNGVNDPTTEGNDGDFYVNTSNSTMFGPRTAGVWGAGISLVSNGGANSKRNCNSYIIPYMPYDTGFAQIIYVTRVPSSWVGEGVNTAGDITAEAVDESGNLYNLGVISTAGLGVNKISPQVGNALLIQGFTGNRIALRISVANPENVYMYTSYVGSTSRGYVEVECQRN
ncbi:hypothetical protein OAA67_04705 [Winogradskyella sp.]|nr:hypothetical protein [Winogradskyella sp.]MDB9754721.1 hypothetical protein [Winogradskyella sp.]